MSSERCEEHYITEDLILAELKLPKPVEIRIDITEDRVQLIIGPRDFGWKRHHPDLTDAGTMFDPPIPMEGNNE